MRNIDSYLDGKLKSNQQTPANKADPKMSVKVSRARTTVMDADYWMVETIREKAGLGDVSVAPRRDRPYGSPNRIYEIHVDNGIVGTTLREYPDTFEEGWKNQFSLGPGLSVAIAFDGHWRRFRKLWRLVTDEKPWVFWVDDYQVLWAQLWDDQSTKRELDNGVLKVKAIRAWKNVNIADQDQGIVVGYIKIDGAVWYRNYCQQDDYSVIWESPKQLSQFSGTAVTLNLFITNDYRMGFAIEDTSKQIHWYITPRNWAGMAISKETIVIRPVQATVDFIPIEYFDTRTDKHTIRIELLEVSTNLLYNSLENRFIYAKNIPDNEDDWGWIIEFETLEMVPTLTLGNIVLLDTEFNVNIPLSSLEHLEHNIYRIKVSDQLVVGLHNTYDTLSLKIQNLYNANNLLHDDFEIVFKPLNLVPIPMSLPEVEEVWNE